MDVNMLKQSFEMVAPQKEVFAHSFYERLFSYYPATRPLFANTNMVRQEESLMATLAVVIAGVERGDNLTPTLHQLGDKHERYGAKPEHYPLVGGVLLETFHEYLGTRFTPAMQDAWSQAFELISGQMIEGSHRQA
ncbi:flavohemoprotein [Dictyobacter vulcani]|uniref:Flavohemoprotein n=1 Tax=Dictyobacter vulcani TaxID=2607529 RepID=A0A5J4KFP8_9CHLR|nr:globin family protein [Dictyobacter vulcani]GER88234.1 flavohemoprotein [Dictyobacter vulcani]